MQFVRLINGSNLQQRLIPLQLTVFYYVEKDDMKLCRPIVKLSYTYLKFKLHQQVSF